MTDGKDLIERHSPAELRAIIEAKDKEIQRLHEDHKIQVDHVVEANKEIERLTASNKNCKAAVVLAKEWIAERDAEIERLSAEHADMNAHCVELEKEIERLTAGYQSLANSHDTYMDENERLRAAIANAGAALCHQAYDRVAEILSEAPQENDDG